MHIVNGYVRRTAALILSVFALFGVEATSILVDMRFGSWAGTIWCVSATVLATLCCFVVGCVCWMADWEIAEEIRKERCEKRA